MLSLLPLLALNSSVPDPQWLRDKLEEVRARHSLPALAAALVWDGKVVAASAVGVRKWGDREPVRRDDAFHLGSVMKPMTSTLVAKMVDQGRLRWDTTVERMFPELTEQMRPEYRTVTVAQLLAHTSGLPYQPNTPEQTLDAGITDAPGRRYAYVKAALTDPLVAPVGTKEVYGGGHILVAAYLERLLKQPFEDLIRAQVFKPLGMTTAGFGDMASPGKVDAPWHHVWKDGVPIPIAPDLSQRIQARAPVGRNGYCSVIDLAKFASAQVRGDFLSPASKERFRTPEPNSSHSVGWIAQSGSWAGETTLWHNGSMGKNYAVCTMELKKGFAACVLTNIGDGAAPAAADEIQFWLLRQAETKR